MVAEEESFYRPMPGPAYFDPREFVIGIHDRVKSLKTGVPDLNNVRDEVRSRLTFLEALLGEDQTLPRHAVSALRDYVKGILPIVNDACDWNNPKMQRLAYEGYQEAFAKLKHTFEKDQSARIPIEFEEDDDGGIGLM